MKIIILWRNLARFIVVFSLLLSASQQAAADENKTLISLKSVLLGSDRESDKALGQLSNNWSNSYVAPLTEIMMLSRDRNRRQRILQTLQQGTGRNYNYDWQDWLRWVWREDIPSFEAYSGFKSWLYRRIDPRFAIYFDKQPKILIDLQEVVWGGVAQDGIPPLRQPQCWPPRMLLILMTAISSLAFRSMVTTVPTQNVYWPGMKCLSIL